MRTARAGAEHFAGSIARCLTLAASCLALSVAPIPPEARAQERAGGVEAPIGTFTIGSSKPAQASRDGAASHDGFSIIDPPAGVPSRRRDYTDDGSGRWFFQGWDRPASRAPSPDDLYKDARAALDAGRTDEAQRLFERLIADAPQSPHVGSARRYLGQIYRSIEAASSAVSTSAEPVRDALATDLPWRSAASGAARVPVLDGLSQPVSRVALYQARVSAAIDSEFLSEAGDRVFFSGGSADLGARARGVIQAQARFLLRHPNLFAAIEGHADDGAVSDAESVRISEARAAVVRERLVAEGVDASRLVAYGRGREDRVSACPEPQCLAQNRRTVTILLGRRVEAQARPARSALGAPAPQGAPTQ